MFFGSFCGCHGIRPVCVRLKVLEPGDVEESGRQSAELKFCEHVASESVISHVFLAARRVQAAGTAEESVSVCVCFSSVKCFRREVKVYSDCGVRLLQIKSPNSISARRCELSSSTTCLGQ